MYVKNLCYFKDDLLIQRKHSDLKDRKNERI